MKYARRRRLENRPIRNGRQRRRCGSRLGCLGGRLLNEGRYRTFEKKLVTLYFCTHIVSGIAYVIVRRNRTQTLRRKCRPEEKKNYKNNNNNNNIFMQIVYDIFVAVRLSHRKHGRNPPPRPTRVTCVIAALKRKRSFRIFIFFFF